MKANFLWVLLATTSFSAVSARAGESADDIKRRFLAEFPDACQRYSVKFRSYQCECENIVKNLAKGTIHSKQKTQSRQNGRHGLFIVTPDPPSEESTEARVVNSRYVFVLRKKPGKDWVLHDLHLVADGVPPSINYMGLDEMARGPYFVGTMWLPDAIKQPEFVIRDATAQNENGRNLIRITYEFKKPTETHTHSGFLVFDPERYWLITENEHKQATAKNALITRSKYEITQEGDLPLVTRATTTQTSTLTPGQSSKSTSICRFTREAADEMEFTLTAFGLPEPYGVEWKRRTPRYIWILVGAGGFVLLAAGLYWLARRQGAKARGDG